MGDGAVRVDQVARIDVQDDDVMSAVYSIWRAAYAEDFPDDPLPTAPEVFARARGPEISGRHEYWLLRDGAVPVGVYELELPLADNLDLVDLSLAVSPEHQHRGHGRVLLDHALRRIATLGRHQVIGSVNEPIDGSHNRPMRFAAAAGAIRSLGEMRRTLDLSALDEARLADLRADAERAADGYQLVSWTGPCPDQLVDGYAALVGRMSTDAPMGGLDIEPEHWDAARIREREERMATQGRTQVATVARLGSDGPLVAFTDIATTRHDPANAFQWDTLVLKEHRGHRLGALVKVANLERLRAEAPAARQVHTWNADENAHMISINEGIGFVPAQRESAWRLDLPRDGGAGR
jgi:GNAT superfamily N-acetyltransferase